MSGAVPNTVTLVVDNGDGTLTCTAWAPGSDAAAASAALTRLFGPPLGDGLLDTAKTDETARNAAIAVRSEDPE